MSINNNSECVRSKYFSGQTAMDESLSDFQEEKKSCKGPKPAQKPSKPKTRKVTKRIKGQKDIRSALKGKKNEVVQYSKEFDNVCKKSGLEVDSEELQLAIALSKSLQTEQTNTPSTSQPSSSQARVAKIRKTLQEYGFKVPEAKITTNKRTKKYRKHYKLLKTTEEEKQQKISGRYSEILFQNCYCSKLDNSSTDINSKDKVIYVATNALYESMKDNSIFYVNNLIEKSTTSGSLLRDWSEIPGRPVSPNLLDNSTMDFTDIECSQEELDVILSGPIKAVKNVFDTKRTEYKRRRKDVPSIVIDHDGKVEQENVNSIEKNRGNDEVFIGTPFGENITIKSPIKQVFSPKTPLKEVSNRVEPESYRSSEKELIDIESCKLKVVEPYRSCSPDIFDENDDEVCSIIETSKPTIVLSQEHRTKVFTEDNFMDLTECANVASQNSEKSNQLSQNKFSQKSVESDILSQNITKRRSNDLMEITECIVGSSQPIREGINEIDLTQSPEEVTVIKETLVDNVSELYCNNSTTDTDKTENDATIIVKLPEKDRGAKYYNIDLTQSSNEKGDKVQEDTLKGNVENQNMDLTQSTNSDNSDDLPIVDFGNSQTEKSLNDTILLSAEEYMKSDGKVRKSTIFENVANDEVYDLTQEVNETTKKRSSSPILKSNVESCNSFYDDFVHDHFDNTENSNENCPISTEKSNCLNNNDKNDKNDANDIDLTQSSDSNIDTAVNTKCNSKDDIMEYIPRNSSLGKKGDVSIDYDEIEENLSNRESEHENSFKLQYDSSKTDVDNDLEVINDINSSKYSNKELEYSLQKSRLDISRQHGYFKCNLDNDVEIINANDEPDINSSQNSEAFHLSDRELDYSLHKSRHDISRQSQDICPNFNVDDDIEIVNDIDEPDINASQNSEAFHISDKELNYSLHKSRHDIPNFDDIEIMNDNNKQDTNSSQNNEDVYIPDEEYYSLRKSKDYGSNDIKIVNNDEPDFNSSQNINKDYSLQKSRHDIPTDNFDFGGISVLDNVTKLSFRKTLSDSAIEIRKTMADSFLPEVEIKGTKKPGIKTQIENTEVPSPLKINDIIRADPGVFSVQTPKNSELIIKTDNVTPMLDYATMSTPQRNKELDKYGLKPFKRKRAIQILTHLYNQMHPTVQELVDENQPSPSKKPRRESPQNTPIKIPPQTINTDSGYQRLNKLSKSPKRANLRVDAENQCSLSSKVRVVKENGGEKAKDVQNVEGMYSYEVTSEKSVIKEVDCDPDDWVFQKREKAKIHSCRVPLHIAFHNYVLSRRSLREAILKYEPVNIDVIHKDLVKYGHRYDPKDLLKFLDKKCITVKTADNNGRINRR